MELMIKAIKAIQDELAIEMSIEEIAFVTEILEDFLQRSQEKAMTQEQLATLLQEIEKKNSWGKNELKDLILKVIAGIK